MDLPSPLGLDVDGLVPPDSHCDTLDLSRWRRAVCVENDRAPSLLVLGIVF